ncbi:MAG: glycosyltransferase [Nitrospirae bacterium]|nr:glycosyltransferase [Nitrospirota bacterium]MCL5976694.1 glycosyltransferase [Nitrospirota bacterium]
MSAVEPKVSVIVTAHNYGKYLPQCLDSVLKQRFSDWEMIVVNDGSTDDTPAILERYCESFPDRMKVITIEGLGLAKACNAGIRASQGKYIIRLDADDYFDENILLIESHILDNDPNIHMVYCDYYRISKYGEILDSYRLPKVNDEIKLLDRSPLAAGAMYRRECYDAIGGYNEELRYQEDYDFWIRFIDKFNVYNVNLPLMYYRKHEAGMSNNFSARMKARQYVKKRFVEGKGYRQNKKIIAIIPAMGLFRNKEKLALKELNGKPLISYIIEEALKTDLIDRVFVSTEDREIAELSVKLGAEVPFLRPIELARTNVSFDKVLKHLADYLVSNESYNPDYIATLHYITPFTKESHITEAIDTMLLYGTDAVISVVTDLTFHWKPGEYGLEMVGYKRRLMREDKETIYKETGSIYIVKTNNLNSEYLGSSVGHIEMSMQDAWKIEDEFSFWVAEYVMMLRRDNQEMK